MLESKGRCENHAGRDGEYLCDVCRTVLCVRCQKDHQKTHKGHHIVPYKEAAIQLIDEIATQTKSDTTSPQLAPIPELPQASEKASKLNEELKTSGLIEEPAVGESPRGEREISKKSVLDRMRSLESEGKYLELYLTGEALKRSTGVSDLGKIRTQSLTSPLEVSATTAHTLERSAGEESKAAYESMEGIQEEQEGEKPAYRPMLWGYERDEIFQPIDLSKQELLDQLKRLDTIRYKAVFVEDWHCAGDESIRALALPISSHRNINAVYIGGDRVTDEGAKIVADVLRTSPHVSSFFLCIIIAP